MSSFTRILRRNKKELIALIIAIVAALCIFITGTIFNQNRYIDEIEQLYNSTDTEPNYSLQSSETEEHVSSSLDNSSQESKPSMNEQSNLNSVLSDSNNTSGNNSSESGAHYGYDRVNLPKDFIDADIILLRKSEKYIVEHDFSKYKYEKSVYVDRDTGDDNTGNGTERKPYRTINKAIQNISSDTNIYVKSKKPFLRGETFPSGYSPDFNVSFINANADGSQIVSTTAQSGLDWGKYNNIFVTTRKGAKGVLYVDNADTDFGWTVLSQKTTLEECENTPGSCFLDGDLVYINTHDGDIPTEDKYLVCITSGENQFYPKDDKTLYIEGFTFIGVKDFSGVEFAKTTSGEVKAKVVLRNCVAGQNDKYAGETYFGNGFSFSNIKSVLLFNCIAKNCRRDGFNYHFEKSTNASECLVIESGCRALNCGINETTENNNLTTCHNGARILRVNTYGRNCRGPMLADVGGCKSLSYGCDIAENVNSSYSYYFQLENKGHAIIIDCKADAKKAIATEGTLYLNGFSGETDSSTIVEKTDK